MPSRRVRVKVSRIYQYPFCVLDKNHPFDDALNKAQENMVVDINHIVNNKFENANQLFTAEITEEPMVPKVKVAEEQEFLPTMTIVYDSLLDKLINYYITTKYGDLDYALHPEHYQPVKKSKVGSDVITSIPRIKEEIYYDIENMRNKFRDMINTSEVNISL